MTYDEYLSEPQPGPLSSDFFERLDHDYEHNQD